MKLFTRPVHINFFINDYILQIVTTLAEWSVNGQANMSTFETDPRFVSLCQLLGRSSNGTPVTSLCDPSKHNIFHEKQGDLSVVLDVKEEDDAAKLASSLTLPQMIKVSILQFLFIYFHFSNSELMSTSKSWIT